MTEESPAPWATEASSADDGPRSDDESTPPRSTESTPTQSTESAPAWPVESTTTHLETPWLTVGDDTVHRPDGETAAYYWAATDPSVAVVAHDQTADELVLVEQYRPKLGRAFRELPAGGIEDGETPVAAARRELREETGYRAETVEELGVYYPAGVLRMARHVCYATDLTPGEPDTDDGEQITVERVESETAVETALSEPTTGWTVTPLLWARETGRL